MFEDINDFIDEDEFAVPAVIKLSSGAYRQVSVIFDAPYLDANTGEYDMDTVRPRVSGKFSDFTGVTRGDVVVVNNRNYDVLTEPQPDGTGWGMLELAEQ